MPEEPEAETKYINVLMFRVNQDARVETIIDTLQMHQNLVDGWIEAVPIHGTIYTLICNEEGKLRELPLNKYVQIAPGYWEPIAGNFFVTRIRNEEFWPLGRVDLELLLEDFVRTTPP